MKMSYKGQVIKRDSNGDPVPQEFNAQTGKFEVLKATIYGKSTESKPTEEIDKGTTYFEIDTSSAFIYDGTKWVEI